MNRNAAFSNLLIGLFIGLLCWGLFSLHDRNSELRYIAADAGRRLNLISDSTSFDAIGMMALYDAHRQYDKGIRDGENWIRKHPNDIMNDLVMTQIAILYLDKGEHDKVNVEDDLDHALAYRDRALPLALRAGGWAAMSDLQKLGPLTEAVGDMLPKGRCVQYGNAKKLQQSLLDIASHEETDPTRGVVSPEQADAKINWLINESTGSLQRIQRKLIGSGCQDTATAGSKSADGQVTVDTRNSGGSPLSAQR